MSVPAAWPEVLDFFGTPLVIQPSGGQLSGDAGLLPSPSRPRRFRSRTVLFHHCGVPDSLIAEFYGVPVGKVSKLLRRYRQRGVAALFAPRAGVRKFADTRYKEMVFTILHA